jgi:SAM-dependent methyltransferase
VSAEPAPPVEHAVATAAVLSASDIAILKTVLYAAVFECALTVERLHRMLWDVPLSRADIAARLGAEPLSGQVSLTQGFIHPLGGTHWVDFRAERQARSGDLVSRHRRVLDLVASLPFVRLVGLTGGAAHDNATDHDLDVFLVARQGRAWSLALAVILLSRALGCRRTLCVNYVVDEDGSALSERDAFTAAEVASLRPWAGAEGYLAFLKANAWVAEHLPNFMEAAPREGRHLRRAGAPRWLERVLDLGPAPLFETASRALLGAHYRRKWRSPPPGVALSPSRLKLHAIDHAPAVRARFAELLEAAGVKGDVKEDVKDDERRLGTSPWPAWRCVECGDTLAARADALVCRREGRVYLRKGPVHLLLPPARRERLRSRVAAYRARRRVEGWRAEAGLPAVAAGHPQAQVWRRRASHLARAESLLAARLPRRPWDLLDVGAGSGWLSARLLAGGHRVVAVDLDLDPDDGLLAADRLMGEGAVLPRAEAEMERLPLGDGLFDCALAAASLHHARDPVAALREMSRVVRPGGVVLVLDSPVYRDARDGLRMLSERGHDTPAAGFFTMGVLCTAMRTAGLEVEIHGWPARAREWCRDLVERVRWGRRTARFPLLLGRVRG